MDDAKATWGLWQGLCEDFQGCFTRPGWVRFVQWVTGMVFGWEEHTITQGLVALGMEDRWRAAEAFAERGAWDREAVEAALREAIRRRSPEPWHGYEVYAGDDTKVHRTSKGVWGTCTFHEYTSRCPNRAETVRAHNWVVTGRLAPGAPWWFLPTEGRLYFRESQLPAGARFRKKPELLVELAGGHARSSQSPCLEVFDGGYAVRSVVRPLLAGDAETPRVEVLTRLREDSRLYAPPVPPAKLRGRPRQWGERLPAPVEADGWPGRWRRGKAWVYGRCRRVRWKRVLCQWHVAGPDERVHAFLFEVEGEKKRWSLVTSALDLDGAAVVEAFAARFRQEDGFRDLKQRLGLEECRAWTAAPVVRTVQVQLAAMTLLRLLHWELDAGGMTWWSRPAWNRKKRHPSILDVRRWLWRFRADFSHFLLALEEVPESTPALRKPRKRRRKAA
jgi:hypothetical protein